MIQAYREVDVPIDIGEQTFNARVPLTLGLIQELETVQAEIERAGKVFAMHRVRRIVDAYRTFAEPYLPAGIDRERIQPAAYAFFFGFVSETLIASLGLSTNSTESTETPPEPTDARIKGERGSEPSRA